MVFLTYFISGIFSLPFFTSVLCTNSVVSNPRDSRSPTGLFISRTCTGVNCKTCLNDKCYDVSGPVFACGNCPLAVCAPGCFGFVMDPTSSCPICRCEGFSTKELCHTPEDCSSGHSCVDSVCRYPAVSERWTGACAFGYHCRSNEICSGCSCVPTANVIHLEQKSCTHDDNCPPGFRCQQFTCWRSVGVVPLTPTSSTTAANPIGFNWLSKLFAIRRLQDG